MELQTRSNNERKDYLLLFLAGLILLFLRSAYTLFVPSLYAEDGAWISSILSNGFLHTLFHARGDYLVCGNILMLGLVVLLNHIFFGDNLNHLPQFVVLIHYCFYSVFALLPVICFKKNVKKIFRLLMWFLVLTVPLGTTAIETMGKISNVGYVFYNIAFLLLFYKINNRNELGKITLAIIDITLLICCTTHPGSYVLVGVAFFVDIAIQVKNMQTGSILNKAKSLFVEYYNREWLLLGCLCTIAFLYDSIYLNANQNVYGFALNKSTIEFVARCLIYYFTYPFYFKLNNAICLIILFSLAALFLFVFTNKKILKLQKIRLAFILCATLFYFIITWAARSIVLTSYLSNYSVLLADRYYCGINIMMMLTVIYTISLMIEYLEIPPKILAGLLGIYMVVTPFVNLTYIFQYDNEPTKLSHVIPFSERIKEATYDANSEKYIVDIDPETWSMQIDEKYYLASLQNTRHAQPLTAANLTDGNWTNGIGVQPGLDNVILLEGKWLSLIENCTSLTSGTQTVNILEIRDYGQWVHVVCDTTDLQAFSYPNEITYTLKQTDG